MTDHPDHCRHWFDPVPGKPPMWLRGDKRDCLEEARMLREHERVHRRREVQS